MAGEYYCGAEAVQRLAILSSDSNMLRKTGDWGFANETRTKYLYPIMRFGRNTTLKILGRKKISSLSTD